MLATIGRLKSAELLADGMFTQADYRGGNLKIIHRWRAFHKSATTTTVLEDRKLDQINKQYIGNICTNQALEVLFLAQRCSSKCCLECTLCARVV